LNGAVSARGINKKETCIVTDECPFCCSGVSVRDSQGSARRSIAANAHDAIAPVSLRGGPVTKAIGSRRVPVSWTDSVAPREAAPTSAPSLATHRRGGSARVRDLTALNSPRQRLENFSARAHQELQDHLAEARQRLKPMTLRPSDNRAQGGRTRAHFVVPAADAGGGNTSDLTLATRSKGRKLGSGFLPG
jgi:hypothetical protein